MKLFRIKFSKRGGETQQPPLDTRLQYLKGIITSTNSSLNAEFSLARSKLSKGEPPRTFRNPVNTFHRRSQQVFHVDPNKKTITTEKKGNKRLVSLDSEGLHFTQTDGSEPLDLPLKQGQCIQQVPGESQATNFSALLQKTFALCDRLIAADFSEEEN